jgi:hypothetical protein
MIFTQGWGRCGEVTAENTAIAINNLKIGFSKSALIVWPSCRLDCIQTKWCIAP